MSQPSTIAELAEHFDVRESVIESLQEDFDLESECDEDFELTLFDYIIEQFAQAHFLFVAIDGGDAVDCLEAYDAAYNHYAPEEG